MVDVGVATITAFVGKNDPSKLTHEDLDAIANYMARNYIVDPLKSFLTVAFPNSGFTQPAYDKNPEKRKQYAAKVLRAFEPDKPKLNERCVFTGQPAVALSLDVDDKLTPGRTFRQHIPLITGEGVINFHPYGDAGLPISGEALLAIQAFPLGCAKVAGRLLAVHADDPTFTFKFARRFLEGNRKAIQTAQEGGQKKLPENPYRASTLLIETLLEIEKELEIAERKQAVSITAYHLSNSGQGVSLDIYHLPMEITDFLKEVMRPDYRQSWDAIRARGWEIVQGKRFRRGEEESEEKQAQPTYNVLYEDLFRLPGNAVGFIRRYFLRVPVKIKKPGDPRGTYSLKTEAHLVSWKLTELFLRKVMLMEKSRLEQIRNLGDKLAEYIRTENDRRFFHSFLTVDHYSNLRALLIRLSVALLKKGQSPVLTLDSFIQIFEEGEDLPRTDWRLARDLVLIRMIEKLYELGWIQAHVEELPEPEFVDVEIETGA